MKAFFETRTYNSFIPLKISTSKGFDFLAHWHNDIEIVYVLEGQLKIGINKESRLLNKGDLAVCSSGDIHYYDSKDLDSKIFLLIFKPELIDYKNIWPQNLNFISPFIKNEFLIEKKLDDRIIQILTSLKLEADLDSNFSSYFIKGLVYELCGLLLTHNPLQSNIRITETKGNSSLKIMQQALQYLEENYMQDINLSDTAKAVNMSTFYFSRIFNQVTGMNFKVYLNSIRIEKAEQMILSNSKNSITNIAFECGFNSIRTFNRVFKSISGKIPSSIK